MSIQMGFNRFKRVRKLFILFLGLYVFQLIAGSLIVYFVSTKQTRDLVSSVSKSAESDLVYNNKTKTWNTSRYDADPDIPGNYRIYVIAKDGFVIDRWRPIPGYLDTSDIKQLSDYEKPQTIKVVTGQTWRMLSRPIKDSSDNTVGLIALGRYGAADTELPQDTDKDMNQIADHIAQNIVVNNGQINTSKVNPLEVPAYIAFQVVDQYNRIQIKSDNSSTINRLPNYIDPSYLYNELRSPSLRILRTPQNKDGYMLKVTPLFDNAHNPIGTIIVARTVAPTLQLMRWYVSISVLFGLVLVPLVCWLACRVIQQNDKTQKNLISKLVEPLTKLQNVKSINFDKEHRQIIIDKQHIPITYATNQYYMCVAVFGSPRKKWETDELIDKFGMEHDSSSWRKIYDAMTSLNKKTKQYLGDKLIITSNKTYQINPKVIDKLT